MSQVFLDADLANRLHQVGQAVELCDPDGKVIGKFVPLVDLSCWEPVTPDVNEAELDRREAENDWVDSAEVLEQLRRLENS
jgi:hypothetical protein